MSIEPSDDDIKNEIVSNVASMQVHMRTNKLRKIICKKISGTKWTQYQRVLDALIKDGSLKTQEVDGESLILSSNDKAAPAPPKQDENKIIIETVEVSLHGRIVTNLSYTTALTIIHLMTNHL